VEQTTAPGSLTSRVTARAAGDFRLSLGAPTLLPRVGEFVMSEHTGRTLATKLFRLVLLVAVAVAAYLWRSQYTGTCFRYQGLEAVERLALGPGTGTWVLLSLPDSVVVQKRVSEKADEPSGSEYYLVRQSPEAGHSCLITLIGLPADPDYGLLGLVDGDVILERRVDGEPGHRQVQRVGQDGRIKWSLDLPQEAIAEPTRGGRYIITRGPGAEMRVIDEHGRISSGLNIGYGPGFEWSSTCSTWDNGHYTLIEVWRSNGRTTVSRYQAETGTWDSREIPATRPEFAPVHGGLLHAEVQGTTVIPQFISTDARSTQISLPPIKLNAPDGRVHVSVQGGRVLWQSYPRPSTAVVMDHRVRVRVDDLAGKTLFEGLIRMRQAAFLSPGGAFVCWQGPEGSLVALHLNKRVALRYPVEPGTDIKTWSWALQDDSFLVLTTSQDAPGRAALSEIIVLRLYVPD